jgi:uncharacterized membrane protein YtjA (UPF0391 family)
MPALAEYPAELPFNNQLLTTSIALARHLPLKGRKEDRAMLYYALVFLIVGLIAGALGLFGIAAMASQISWILFLIGIVILVIHLVSGRGIRVP